jgi:hypothetical protein
MASLSNAIVCALIATSVWWLIGYAVARRLVPRVLALATAPVIGWSVHSAATLPIYLLFGFSPLVVIGIGLCLHSRGRLFAATARLGERDRGSADRSGLGVRCCRHSGVHSGGYPSPEIVRRRRLAR